MSANCAGIAWRNIWRNRRRTVLTIVAVTFGTLLIVIQRGMQTGTFDRMVETAVRRSEGHIQIHAHSYWESRTLHYAFPIADVDTAAVAALPHVRRVSTKLAVDALVGSGEENTTGARVVGVIPSREAAMTFFGSGRMVEGRFLDDSDTTGAVIGRTMAQNLHARVGDELVFFTQGRDGSMAAAVLCILGIFRAGEPDMDWLHRDRPSEPAPAHACRRGARHGHRHDHGRRTLSAGGDRFHQGASERGRAASGGR